MRTHLSTVCAVLGVIVAAIVLGVLCPQPARAQAQRIKQKFNAPIDVTFGPADFSCLTEDVHIFGTNPTRTQFITDARGGVHLQMQATKDVTAVGLSTGDSYKVTGPEVTVVYDFDSDPNNGLREVFFHNLLHILGPGTDGSMLLRETFHAVFSSNGVQVVDISKEDLLCR